MTIGDFIAFGFIIFLVIMYPMLFIYWILCHISKKIKKKQEFKKSRRDKEAIKIKKFLMDTDITYASFYKNKKINTIYKYYDMLDNLVFYLRDICDYNGRNIKEDMEFILKEIRRKGSQYNITESMFNTWLLEIVSLKYHLKEVKLDKEQTEIFFLIKKSFIEEKITREKEKEQEIKEIKKNITNANKQLLLILKNLHHES